MQVESLVPGVHADCAVADESKEIITIRSSTALEVKAVTVGAACLQSYGVNRDNIGFVSPFISSHPADYSQSTGDTEPGNLTIVELERFPSSGIATFNKYLGVNNVEFYCAITAPTIKLDLQDGGDIWLHHFRVVSSILRSAARQIDPRHGLSNVAASISSQPNGDLRLETSFTDTGYGRTSLVLRRALGNTFINQRIADVKNESAGVGGAGSLNTTTWRPVFRSFDFILIRDSTMMSNLFISKLAIFNAQPTDPSNVNPAKPLGLGGQGVFVLSDRTDIKYTIRMTGYRRLLSDDDEAGMSLQLSS